MIKLEKGLFAGTLSEVTQNYIQDKCKEAGNEDFENLDLRDMCSEVLLSPISFLITSQGPIRDIPGSKRSHV